MPKKKDQVFYQLTVTKKQLRLIKTALEEYFRLGLNQWWDLADRLAMIGVDLSPNPNIAAKLAYVEKAYDEDLHLKSCPDISIEEYHIHYPMDEVMDFGVALMNLKDGHRVARKGWNGKGMFLYHVPAAAYPPCTDVAREAFGGEPVPYGAYIAMKTAQGNVVPWMASQTDMLAEDWIIL